MAKSKNSCDKKQRTPRGERPGDKKLNRTGGGKPQPRTISSPSKVLGIQKAAKAATLGRLQQMEVALDDDVVMLVEYATGLDDSVPHRYNLEMRQVFEEGLPAEEVAHIEKMRDDVTRALYHACKLVPNAEFAFDGDPKLGFPAIRGRNFGLFLQLAEQEKKQNEAVAKRRAANNRNRHHGSSGTRPAKAIGNNVGQQLAAAGIANGNRANVATQVAKASGLVSAN